MSSDRRWAGQRDGITALCPSVQVEREKVCPRRGGAGGVRSQEPGPVTPSGTRLRSQGSELGRRRCHFKGQLGGFREEAV